MNGLKLGFDRVLESKLYQGLGPASFSLSLPCTFPSTSHCIIPCLVPQQTQKFSRARQAYVASQSFFTETLLKASTFFCLINTFLLFTLSQKPRVFLNIYLSFPQAPKFILCKIMQQRTLFLLPDIHRG